MLALIDYLPVPWFFHRACPAAQPVALLEQIDLQSAVRTSIAAAAMPANPPPIMAIDLDERATFADSAGSISACVSFSGAAFSDRASAVGRPT